MKRSIKGNDRASSCDVTSEFQAAFHRLRAAVAEEKHVGFARHDLAEFIRKPQRGFRSVHSKRSMHHPIHLCSGCRHDARMIVADIAGTEPGNKVEVGSPIMPDYMN